MMYHGRSIGRMLEWLREMTTRADYLIFHPGGKVTLFDKVVIEKTEWDEYDNPTFIFVDESEDEKQWRKDKYLRMRQREFTDLHHRMDSETRDALLNFENLCLKRIRRNSISTNIRKLIDWGLLEEEKKLVGWDDDERGSPLFDIDIKLSPQGRGFIKSFEDGEWKTLW